MSCGCNGSIKECRQCNHPVLSLITKHPIPIGDLLLDAEIEQAEKKTSSGEL